MWEALGGWRTLTPSPERIRLEKNKIRDKSQRPCVGMLLPAAVWVFGARMPGNTIVDPVGWQAVPSSMVKWCDKVSSKWGFWGCSTAAAVPSTSVDCVCCNINQNQSQNRKTPCLTLSKDSHIYFSIFRFTFGRGYRVRTGRENAVVSYVEINKYFSLFPPTETATQVDELMLRAKWMIVKCVAVLSHIVLGRGKANDPNSTLN